MIKLKAESSKEIVSGLKEIGIDFISSLPSNNLVSLIHDIMNDPDFMHVPVANETGCIGLCYGAYLTGKKPAFVAQNSGLLMATYALMDSIYWFGNFPLLMVIDHRGDFGDPSGWNFVGYGLQIPKILESFQVPYMIVREPEKLKAEVVNGGLTATACRRPACILISGEEI